METRAVRYGIKTVGWEYVALTCAYSVIFGAALVFLYMVFHGSDLIAANRTGVDPALYRESHTFIVLIEVILWAIMARAAIRFKSYAREISPSKDGKALNYIANAMLLSVVYAILFDAASTVKTQFINSPNLHFVTTVTNLVPLALFLFLSILLYIGTIKLKRLLPDQPPEKHKYRNRQLMFLSIAVFTLLLIPYGQYFHQVALTMMDDDGLQHFVISPNVLTYVYLIPFALVWLLGVLSCINLADYANRVRGEVYRRTFRNLYLGILIAYISTYFIQIWYTSNLSANKFGPGLSSLIILIAFLISGFALIYRGANQLYRIELEL